MNENDEIREE